MTAIKHDDGKVSRKYIHPETLNEMGRAHEVGLSKYGEYNFLEGGFTYSRLLSAALRHIELALWGHDEDEDGTKIVGKPVTHLGCALANINMLITCREYDKLTDDRFRLK